MDPLCSSIFRSSSLNEPARSAFLDKAISTLEKNGLEETWTKLGLSMVCSLAKLFFGPKQKLGLLGSCSWRIYLKPWSVDSNLRSFLCI